MDEYFKPWRRKVGTITLVMACALSVAWVRSGEIEDAVGTWRSRGGVIENVIQGYPVFARPDDGVFDYDNCGWQWPNKPRDGISFRTNPNWSLPEMICWRIPYWSIVVPLTLISAWLLLSKPRRKPSSALD